MAFTMISDLTPLKESWRIKVRIVRLWYQPDYSNPKKINSLELILVDEKGSKIQATIKESLIRRFEGLVKEGTSRIISSFGMITNAGKHLATSHAYKVNFYYRTIVRDCEDAQLPQYGFDFVSFDKILKQQVNELILVDVIGELTGMGDLINISKNDTPNHKLTIELEDLHKNKLTCALYGKYAEQLSESTTKDDIQGPIIVVLQFAKIKSFRDEVSISNSLWATKLFINNEDIPEVQDYKRSVQGEKNSQSHVISHLSSQNSHSISDEFLNLNERKQLDEICETNEECFCVTYATIIAIENDSKWYYNSCKNCNKKADYEGGGKYWCKKCDSHVKSAPPRYKLTIIVEDDSGTASFIMFDQEVYQILQISAVDLKEKLSKDGKDDSFPEELDMLIDRKFLFRFHISKYNLSHSWDKYTVLRISDDEQLIKSFLDVNGGLQEKGVEIESIDESSKSSIDKDKELATVVCDNENPNVSFVTPTKRPLDDATNVEIDDETSSAQRSTNKKKVVVKIEKEDNTNNG